MNRQLVHYGIKGMRWGIRRSEAQLARARGRKTEPHEDYTKAHTKKSVKEMSDSELRSRINRLQMEQQYSKLSSENVSKGKFSVNKILKAGTTVAAATTTAITLYNNSKKIKEIFDAVSPGAKQSLAGAAASAIIGNEIRKMR